MNLIMCTIVLTFYFVTVSIQILQAFEHVKNMGEGRVNLFNSDKLNSKLKMQVLIISLCRICNEQCFYFCGIDLYLGQSS